MMTALDEEDLFITFEELLHLNHEDISLCVDKHIALSICRTSSAPPSKIYNLWVQKLLKVYNKEGFSTKDWQTIIEYLDKVLREFVRNFNSSDDTSCEELEQWWLDSQDLLKWMEAVVDSLDICILCLVMSFVLEIIIKTCKFSNDKNFKTLCNIQQLAVNLSNNYLYKIPIKELKDSESFIKIISSLCDVGSIISSIDLKTSVETWHAVAKLSEKLYNSKKKFSFAKNSPNLENNWSNKAILGIFNELKNILKFFDQNPSKNEKLLQIAQFYLKILKLIINYAKETTKTFPALKEFIEIYTFCQHEIVAKENPKIELFVKKPLFDIFSLISMENSMAEVILQHIKTYDMEKFESCNLVFDYLKLYSENCTTNSSNPDIEMTLKIYNCLLEGTLFFIDKDKYPELLKTFLVLTVMDSTNQMHKKLCEYVIDLSWIRAYTSMEILSIYYSYIFKHQQFETDSNCLQFWFTVWNKLNRANETYKQHKKLVEVLLKAILSNIPDDMVQEYNFNVYESSDIILLKSGKQFEKCLQYLNTNLAKNLKKMQERSINGVAYKELINLLEICVLQPQLLNDFLKAHLLTTLKGFLLLPASDLQTFHEFINLSFGIFNLKLDQQQNQKLLQYLMEHEQQCCSIQSVFFVEFLLKQKPHSTKLLQALNVSNNLTSTIINIIECKPSNNPSIDLNIFKNLPLEYQQSNCRKSDLEQMSKRPRLDEGNCLNIKVILNDLNESVQKLVNIPCLTFDDKDFALMRSVKNTIEKCLKN